MSKRHKRPTPGAGQGTSRDDRKRQMMGQTSVLPGHLSGAWGMLPVVFCVFEALVRCAGCDDITEQTIIVERYQVQLAEQLGLGAEGLLDALCSQSGHELFHLREGCQEVEVGIDVGRLLRGRLPKRAGKNNVNTI